MKTADKTIKPKAIKEKFKDDFDIVVDKALIKNALFDAKKFPQCDNRGFGRLSGFLKALAENNEGTTTSVSTSDGVFQRAFLCPGMCSRAFGQTTKIAGLDACHIKARYGVVLVLTILDGNGGIFPVAVGIAEGENTETWFWFLCLVKTALHIDDEGDGLVFLSDREKGIDTALKWVFPRAAHGYCVFHMIKNVTSQFHVSMEGLFYKAARVGTAKEFEEVIAEMKLIDQDAGTYIEKMPWMRWARAFFPLRRLGHVTSNIAESMNHWLDEARRKDPVGLFSTFIRQLNNLFEKRRNYSLLSPKERFQKGSSTC